MQLRDYLSPLRVHEWHPWFLAALNEWTQRPDRAINQDAISIAVDVPGELVIRVSDFDGAPLELRSIRHHDASLLHQLSALLSARSKELFAPYPWDDPRALPGALEAAVRKAVEQTDAGFIITHGDNPIGHFFLWRINGNTHSQAYDVDIPELGVAIADRYHGRGLGSLAVTVLQSLARGLDKDAIELTTAMDNDAGYAIYQRAGFEYIGPVANPLGVDVVAAVEGSATPPRYRQERQLVYVIHHAKRNRILAYLAQKRALFETRQRRVADTVYSRYA